MLKTSKQRQKGLKRKNRVKTLVNKNKVKKLVGELIRESGFNPEEERLRKTPERVAAMLKEIFASSKKDPRRELKVFKTSVKNEIILIKDIPFFSFCEHHLLPFFGMVHIAYIPVNGVIAGFSNFVALVKVASRRLQLQERLNDEIVDALMDILKPEGAVVVIEARHFCVEMRGEKQPGTVIITSSVRGKMKEESAQEMIMKIVRG